MRLVDLRHAGRERVIGTWDLDGVLVDPGPESCLDTLVGALGDGYEPRAILLTHIHLDHAGATGALLERWPGLSVFVHQRGARHLADPERLVASATRLYGEAGMARLWGTMRPVPEERIRVLHGGERLLDGAYRVAYTPGHASHHVAYLHEASGRAFVGDAGGIVIPPADYVIAPTPPPDVDLEAWETSLDTLLAWAPETLAVSHFGSVEDPPAQLAGVREALHFQAGLAAELDSDAFVAAMRARAHERAPGHEETYAQAAPLEQQWAGIDRWHAKRATRR